MERHRPSGVFPFKTSPFLKRFQVTNQSLPRQQRRLQERHDSQPLQDWHDWPQPHDITILSLAVLVMGVNISIPSRSKRMPAIFNTSFLCGFIITGARNRERALTREFLLPAIILCKRIYGGLYGVRMASTSPFVQYSSGICIRQNFNLFMVNMMIEYACRNKHCKSI